MDSKRIEAKGSKLAVHGDMVGAKRLWDAAQRQARYEADQVNAPVDENWFNPEAFDMVDELGSLEGEYQEYASKLLYCPRTKSGRLNCNVLNGAERRFMSRCTKSGLDYFQASDLMRWLTVQLREQNPLFAPRK